MGIFVRRGVGLRYVEEGSRKSCTLVPGRLLGAIADIPGAGAVLLLAGYLHDGMGPWPGPTCSWWPRPLRPWSIMRVLQLWGLAST